MAFRLKRNDTVRIIYDEAETEAVKLAAGNLKTDIVRTVGADIADFAAGELKENGTSKENITEIIVGTIGISGQLKGQTVPDGMYDEAGKLHKEAFGIRVSGDRLFIMGSDRRGTIYGIYDLCEQLGVSPWYYFADVPVRERDVFELPAGYEKTDYPVIEYRGFFINDEEELEKWVQQRLGEATIGVKAYEKIFELLLRLKVNYIWPAMHVNSFNMVKENGALADRMGIVVGTSHCDMLMRSNNREWEPWKKSKGYEDALYDFSIEGRNREILKEYWRESVEQNKDFEVSYTLGMRGVHDSGFEIRGLADKTGDELLRAKVELLENIINTQDKLLKDTVKDNPLKLFVPYKEVLPLYDAGLKVPEDFTLIWANDNYGYVRRYPSEAERQRKGGNGIYYHNSYWAGAGMSYVFLCSIPLAHTGNELMKAYNEGIRKLWIMNIGAMKPLEQEMEFFAALAWNAGRENAPANDVDKYVSEWIDRNFSGGHGMETADILNSLSQLANMRKIENMDNNIFSQTAYGDEAAVRVNRLKELFDRANRVYDSLPDKEKDAFFQMVLLKVHAVYYTCCQYYYADRSCLCTEQGKMQAAGLYTEYAKEYEDARRKLIYYYNNIMAEGKWKGIVTPEEFPPPKTAMYPVCMPPLHIGESRMLITLYNDGGEINFVKPSVKWFELANAGMGELEFEAEAPSWLHLSEMSGTVGAEKRIMVSVDEITEDKCGEILIRNKTDNSVRRIKVTVSAEAQNAVSDKSCAIEDDGAVTVRADSEAADGWRAVRRLGRGSGALMEAEKPGAVIAYPFYLFNSGEFLLEMHRFPSLNSVGRIRIEVKTDDNDWQLLESFANDEKRSTWVFNVLNNVDKLSLRLPYMEKGIHTVYFRCVDKYFAFSKFVIYTKERKENNMACGAEGDQSLPLKEELDALTEKLYGKIRLLPRKAYYASWKVAGSTLPKTDTEVQPSGLGRRKAPDEIFKGAESIFAEQNGCIRIDAVTAYAQTEYAYTENFEPAYSDSESYARSGLAIYIRDNQHRNAEKQFSLNYRVDCCGGSSNYTVWALLKINPFRNSACAVSVDGIRLADEELYNKGGKLLRYEAEHNWRWVPLAKTCLTKGEHLITISTAETNMRFDRIFIADDERLPYTDDCWEEI